MSFAKSYFIGIINCLIPFALGTILIVISPVIKRYNKNYSLYSIIIGMIVSILSGILIISNFAGIVGQFV